MQIGNKAVQTKSEFFTQGSQTITDDDIELPVKMEYPINTLIMNIDETNLPFVNDLAF